jgi:hypothetical protein
MPMFKNPTAIYVPAAAAAEANQLALRNRHCMLCMCLAGQNAVHSKFDGCHSVSRFNDAEMEPLELDSALPGAAIGNHHCWMLILVLGARVQPLS